MNKNLVNKLVLPLVAVTGLGLGGCFPTLSPKGKEFRDYMAHQAVDEIIRGEIKSSQGHRDYQTNRNDYQRGQDNYRKPIKHLKPEEHWTPEEMKIMDKFHGHLSLDQIRQVEYIKKRNPNLEYKEIILNYISSITKDQRKRIEEYFPE